MDGLEVTLGGETVKAAQCKGVVTFILSAQPGDIYLHLGGLDNEKRAYLRWYRKDLKAGDRIKVRVTDVSVNTPTYECEYIPNETLLEKYKRLENKLKKKGLI